MAQPTQEQIDAYIAAVRKAEEENAANTRVADAKKESEQVQYTIFASGLTFGGRNNLLEDKNFTDNIALIFDVVTVTTYSRSASKTKFSTEDRVTFSDHVVLNDGKFTMTGKVSPSPTVIQRQNWVDKDTDTRNPRLAVRPEMARILLEKMFESNALLTIVTEEKILSNYIITDLTVTRDVGDGGDSLTFEITFEEFRTFTLGRTVLATVYENPKKSPKKQKGAVNSDASTEDVKKATESDKSSPFLKDKTAAGTQEELDAAAERPLF